MTFLSIRIKLEIIIHVLLGMTRIRGKAGKYIQKSDQPRLVRSLRLTDEVWSILGDLADEENITKADLIENIAFNIHVLHDNLVKENERLKKEITYLEAQIKNLDTPNQLSLLDIPSAKTYTLEDLTAKAKSIIYDETIVRTRDRGAARKYFGLLLDVDRDLFK